MDERTRTTDDDLTPGLPPSMRRTAPQPAVKARRYTATRIGIGLIIVVLLALGAYQIGRWVTAGKAPTGRVAVNATQSVGASTVVTSNVPVIVNALGTVTPIATVTVQSQISGYLTKVAFIEGQTVQKGQLLAQIDDRPYLILKAQYEGQLAHDQGLLSQAQMDLKRYQTLAQQNSIARQQSEDQVFIVQQYQGTVKQDQSLIDAQTLNIAYCHIVSPVTGRIGLRLVDPGNYVQPSSATGLAVVTELQPITVIFSIPEDELPDVLPQLNAGTKLQATAFDRANIKQLAVGSVMAVDSQIDTTTGTVRVRAQFDNADNALFPNQFVNVQLLVKTLQNALTIPTAAIQRGSPGATTGGAMGTYVYLVNADSTVAVRQITVGPTYVDPHGSSMTTVESGLAAGDKVVTDGADRLRDGLHVRVSSVDGKQVAPAAVPAGDGGQKGKGGGRSRRQGGGTGQ
ncbi:MAG TPA: efflux RND transporter periplasmic adaptor subunit [Xanthobacteraceae bacterium]|nr:efflux RND transporter periplasmic adaptor subunit [Xanthobacteraceae bacterium]